MANCKLCHNRKDTIKKQFNDLKYHWEKKICPECGDYVWIYRGKNTKSREKITDEFINKLKSIGYCVENDNELKTWIENFNKEV